MKPYIKNYSTSLLSRLYTFLTTPFSYAKVFLPRLRYTHLLSTSFLLASLFFLTSCACTGDGGIGEKSSEAQIISLELTIAGTDETITFDNDDNATVTAALSFTTLGNSVTVKDIALSDGASAKDQNGNDVYTSSSIDIANDGGTHSITLTITAEDGTVRTYTIVFDFKNSDNGINFLELNIARKDYVVSFDNDDSATIVASASFENLPTSVTVKDITLSDGASAKDHNDKDVSAGSIVDIADGDTHSITLTITAEDGTVRTYTIVFDFKNSGNGINFLELNIARKDYVVSFDNDDSATIVASASFENLPTSVTVKDITLSDGASAKDHNGNDVSAGSIVDIATTADDHSITLTSTVEDETVRTYTIVFDFKNSDKKINTLTIKIRENSQSITFNAIGQARATFGLFALSDQPTVATIETIAISNGATATDANDDAISESNEIPITSDRNNKKIFITITADDGTKKKYTINISYVVASRATLSGHALEVSSISFNHDSTRLASGSGDKTIKIWDGNATGTGATPLATLSGHTERVTSVDYNHDGTRLASGSDDFTVKIWDGNATGKIENSSVLATFTAHTNKVYSVAYNHNGTRLASSGREKTIKIWNANASGEVTAPLATLSGHNHFVHSVAFSPDGTKLASGSWDETIKIWDGNATGTDTTPLATLSGHRHFVLCVTFNHDGSRLASGSFDYTVRIWDGTVTGEVTAPLATLSGHRDRITSVAFNHDGTRLASGSRDDTARVWNLTNRTLITTLLEHTKPVWSVAFNHDYTKLASGSGDRISGRDDRSIKIWEYDW